jgi:glucose-6-phosphate isomerase
MMERRDNPTGSGTMQIDLDHTYMMRENVGGAGPAFTEAELFELQERTDTVHEDLMSRRDQGRLGFWNLLESDVSVDEATAAAAELRGRCRDVLVLGIGGSALGTIAMQKALCHPFHHVVSGGNSGVPRLFVADNIDPSTFSSLLGVLDWQNLLVLVISKSGTTAETMSQFMIVRERLIREVGREEATRRIVAITDPEKGLLRTIADREGYRTMAIPPAVGGRFSVLTPVGLLPAALVGIDIRELMAGARAMALRCEGSGLAANPAYRNGALHYLADVRKGLNIHVYFAYADGLYGLADWLRQLIAESLGKRYGLDGSEVHTGPTPAKALGVTDQHSQVQLYAEGPFDKVITFLALDRFPGDSAIPESFEDLDGVSYLGGSNLQDLFQAERRATIRALAEAGRLSVTLRFPELNAYTLGQAFFLYELQTVFMGGLYGINPLDQPGVERGKQLTYGMMGRKGYEQYRF